MAMPPKPAGPLTRLWMRWKSLSLPWRKKRLIGIDLSGTTFWEFRDALVAGRQRRVAQHARGVHYADVQVSPAWHQWLRHTRAAPPSLAEQQADVVRQANLRRLAADADARWAAKPSFLDGASTQAGRPSLPSSKAGEGEVGGDRRGGGGFGAAATAGVASADGVEEVEGPRREVNSDKEKDRGAVNGNNSSSTATAAPTKSADAKAASRGKARNPGSEWQPDTWSPASRKR